MLANANAPLVGHVGRCGRRGDDEVVTGVGHVEQAQDLPGWTGGHLDLLALVVDERPDPAPCGTGHERVADLERAPLHQHGGHGPPADVELGLEHHTHGPPGGVGLEVLDVGDDEEVLEQVVDAEALERRHLDHDRVATPRLGDEAPLGELAHDPLRIGVVAVDLVDGDHDRHAGRPGVLQGLDRLRHDAVVGRDHQDHDVGGLGATGTHGGERLVARGVDEGDARRP